ncbi:MULTISPECIES: hypothetical protein [Nocardiopsis]|uniref:Uncharacterized protein n=1 Tax=Nocardiopsis sinuspersici TaxID=501010 RepID=A0A1V3C2P7_9ACTN|nr:MULTISPECIES: hypothetical protein [Nocardiopsis]OOC54902.1 hypothetical protein NOSIN_14760 [Nocardiopsis sinuspersici]
MNTFGKRVRAVGQAKTPTTRAAVRTPGRRSVVEGLWRAAPRAGSRGGAFRFRSVDGTGDVTILWNPAGIQDCFPEVGEAEAREDFEHLWRLESFGLRVLDRAPVDGA